MVSCFVCTAASAVRIGLAPSPISTTLLLVRNSDARFGSDALQLLLILNDGLQQLVELLVADKSAPQVRKAVPLFQELAKRRNLPGDLRRSEIVHALEPQIDIDL